MTRPTSLLAFLLAGTCLLAPAHCRADDACVDAVTERCADDRLAAGIADLLAPAELAFVSIGKNHHMRAIGVAADELVWSRVRESDSDAPLHTLAAQMLIDSYLRTGLDSRAIELFDSLDGATRDAVTSGPIVFGTHVRGTFGMAVTLYVETSPQLNAAGLSLALSALNRKAQADALLVHAERPVDIGPEKSWAGDLVGPSKIVGACVRALLDPGAQSDWFLWAFGDSTAARGGQCRHAAAARTFHRRMLGSLRAAGLPERWMPTIEPNDTPGSVDSYQGKLDAALATLPAMRTRIDALAIELAAIDRADARDLESTERDEDDDTAEHDATPSPADRELARILEGRLAAPVYTPYRIVPSPSGPTRDADANEPSTGCQPRALRCHEAEGVRWELSNSKDYDPTGEVPAAGFWLARIANPGDARRDYYLGIKEHNPFELVASDVPLVVDGVLRLTVRRAQIDVDRIAFPPMGLQFDSNDALLELSATLSDIARDSDGDGLTDLAEQQLLLDPRSRDSDGDGLADAKDSLPGVAYTSGAAGQHQAIAAALKYLVREPDWAISAEVPASAVFAQRRSSSERTLFLVADPASLGGMSSEGRIIVLPISLDRTLLAAHPSFRVFLPLHVSLRMLDDDHAELDYSGGGSRGTLALNRRDGVWRVASFEAWVS